MNSDFTFVLRIILPLLLLLNVLDVSALSFVEDVSAGVADAGADHAGHSDPSAFIFLSFVLVILTAVLGRYISKKLGQAVVLGELVLGMVLGSLLYMNNGPLSVILHHQSDIKFVTEKVLQHDMTLKQAVASFEETSTLDPEVKKKIIRVMENPNFGQHMVWANEALLLSSFGVLLLLFMVGLENSYEDILEVGGSALTVALLGVALPFILGYLALELMLPEGHDQNVSIFVGATLVATSIGITARIFKDMKVLHMSEAKIVIGASVIDDIMGLIVLAVVSGIVTTGVINPMEVALILVKSIAFVVIILWFGKKYLKRNIHWFAKMDSSFVGLLYPFTLLMLLSYLSDLIGLASIVGAFAAGLIIKEEYFEGLDGHSSHTVENLLAPLEGIFAPMFFVLMGFQVNVSSFADVHVLGFALVLTVVAIVGKMGSALFLKGQDKLIVGIGLVPRAEVGLIFASIGKALGVIDADMFSVVILVVLLTTLVTPPALKWAIERHQKKTGIQH